MTIGLIRAKSLIHLQHLDVARDVLQEISSWFGCNDQRTRAIFLIGWIYLHQNEPTRPLEALHRLIKKYPDTGFSAKTLTLIQRLEGS